MLQHHHNHNIFGCSLLGLWVGNSKKKADIRVTFLLQIKLTNVKIHEHWDIIHYESHGVQNGALICLKILEFV
jgi:hypothetical protein